MATVTDNTYYSSTNTAVAPNTTTNSTTNSGTNSTTNSSNSTNSTTNSTSSSSKKTNSMLDKDAFLKLLLIEMQNQDPTDPMDTDKMLTQTSQLAALEMQQNTNETMQTMVDTMTKLADSMNSTGNLAALNAIGKMATISDTTFKLENSTQSISARMYLPKETKDGATFTILDSKGNVVKSIKVAKDQLKVGTNVIGWDGRKDDGTFAGAGSYSMKTSYTDVDGGTSTSTYGSYPVESVKFKDGTLKLVIAGKEVNFTDISQLS